MLAATTVNFISPSVDEGRSRFWSRAPCGIRTAVCARRSSSGRASCGRPPTGSSCRSPPSRASAASTSRSSPRATGRQAGRATARDQGRSDRRRQLSGARRPEARRPGRRLRRAEAVDGAPIAPRRKRRPPAPKSAAVPWHCPAILILIAMVVDTFIRRPILASVCSLVIILAGAIAIPTLPIAQFPELAPPTVHGQRVLQGASAEVVETAVTTPIEQALNGVEGMQYMTSSSGSDGIVVDHRHLRRRPRHRRRGGRRPEPHLAGRRAGCRTR